MVVATLIRALLIAALPGAVAADALERIGETGVLRIGVREASAPFSYRNAEGAAAGLAVRLCYRVAGALADRLGQEIWVEAVFTNSETRFSALALGEVDLHCGPMTQTLARREALDFSIPYFMDGIGAVLRRDGVQDVAELNGQPVGALAGTTGIAMATRWAEAGASPVIAFDTHRAGLEALSRGEIDVYFGDRGLLLHQISVLKSEDRLIPIRLTPDQFSYEPYALAMRAGEHNLRIETDRALSEHFLTERIFDDIEAEMGEADLSDLAAFLYVLVALPE